MALLSLATCQEIRKSHSLSFSSPHFRTFSTLHPTFARRPPLQCTALPKRPMSMPGPRSRQGCDECRKRRRKCDEQKPRCGQCISFNRTCEYHLRVVWQDGSRKPSLSGMAPLFPAQFWVWRMPTDPSKSPKRRETKNCSRSPSQTGPQDPFPTAYRSHQDTNNCWATLPKTSLHLCHATHPSTMTSARGWSLQPLSRPSLCRHASPCPPPGSCPAAWSN